MPKIIKVGQCFTELFKKYHLHSFFETRCINFFYSVGRTDREKKFILPVLPITEKMF